LAPECSEEGELEKIENEICVLGEREKRRIKKKGAGEG